MRLELEAYHVVLELDLSPELPTIRGHRGQLTQVLMNGVKNGVESLATISDRERQLRIRTLPLEPDGVAIRIEDSGRGLDPVARDRVFEPFYSTKPRGMGLGLAICKSIIEGHEGTLSLLPGSPHGAGVPVLSCRPLRLQISRRTSALARALRARSLQRPLVSPALDPSLISARIEDSRRPVVLRDKVTSPTPACPPAPSLLQPASPPADPPRARSSPPCRRPLFAACPPPASPQP